MNIACPECSTIYRVDPDRVPDGGTDARCKECDTTFHIDAETTTPAGEMVTGARVDSGRAESDVAVEEATPPETAEEAPAEVGASVEAAEAVAGTAEAGESPFDAPAEVDDESDEEATDAPVFGPQDPETRARRLARALVSDIKVYHPDKWEEAAEAGTLRSEFRDEIMKSWEEYVEQVGEDMAKKTPYFRDALNQILAEGDHVF